MRRELTSLLTDFACAADPAERQAIFILLFRAQYDQQQNTNSKRIRRLMSGLTHMLSLQDWERTVVSKMQLCPDDSHRQPVADILKRLYELHLDFTQLLPLVIRDVSRKILDTDPNFLYQHELPPKLHAMGSVFTDAGDAAQVGLV